MRQIMPHRSSMVADLRRCKGSFYRITERSHHFCVSASAPPGGAFSIHPIFATLRVVWDANRS